MADAREAVARAQYRSQMAYMQGSCREWDDLEPELQSHWLDSADAALEVLRPIIAAEIRDYTKAARVSWTIGKHTYALDEFARDADAIASRICGEGEQ